MSFLLFLEVFFANLLTRGAAIACAFWLVTRPLARYGDAMLAAACGFLLTMSLTHLLPEAFEVAGTDPHELGIAMLAVVLLFIIAGCLLGGGHAHDAEKSGARGLPALFAAASLHGFVDGILIATTFLVSEKAGWLAALAVLMHELPQQAGFMVILGNAGKSPKAQLLFCSGIALSAVAGGVAGLAAIGSFEGLLPYALAMSAASFIYITLFALLPEVFEGVGSFAARSLRLGAVLLGCILSLLVLGAAHDHEHDHAPIEGFHAPHAEENADGHLH